MSKLYKTGDLVVDGSPVYIDPNNLPTDIVQLYKYYQVHDFLTGCLLPFSKISDRLPKPALDYTNAFPDYKVGTIDIEVFPNWWCVVLSNADGVHVFRSDTHLDNSKLKRFLSNHDFVMGYNIKEFDAPLLKMMTEGCSTHTIYDATCKIINDHIPGWKVLRDTCDSWVDFGVAELMPVHEPGGESVALKYIEAITGERVFECDVPFDKEDLSEGEKARIIEYCKYDVEATESIIFPARQSAIEAEITLAKMCSALDGKRWQDHLKKSSNSKSAIILGFDDKDYSSDEWEQKELLIELAKRFKPQKKDFKEVYKWFAEQVAEIKAFVTINSGNYEEIKAEIRKRKKNVTLDNGCIITFGLGGQHGAFERYIKASDVWDSDVSSMYPSIMTEYNLMSRRIKYPEKLKTMTLNRIEMKTKNPQAADAYKIILVSVFGAMGNRGGQLYDPKMMRSVCITGQLALLKLVEMLEPYVYILNTNTDGIFFTVPKKSDWDKVIELHTKWQEITGLQLEINGRPQTDWKDAKAFFEMHQFDVNDYILCKTEGGEITNKGVKTSGIAGPFSRGKVKLQKYDGRIIKQAIVAYLAKGIPIEDTIRSCEDAREFMFVSKSTKQVFRDGKEIRERILRFARVVEGGSSFTKSTAKAITSIANAASGAELFHDNLNELSPEEHKAIISRLDMDYYIELAEMKLSGITFDRTNYKGTFKEFLAHYPKFSPLADDANYPIYRVNDPASWQLWDGAFPTVMLPYGDIWAVDIDECLRTEPQGKAWKELLPGKWISPKLFKWLETLDCYTELSAGGFGIHCITLAKASDIPKKVGTAQIDGFNIELFNVAQSNHSITITGKQIECFSNRIDYKTAAIKKLLKTLPDSKTKDIFEGRRQPPADKVKRHNLMIAIANGAVCAWEEGQQRYPAILSSLYCLKMNGFSVEERKTAALWLFKNCHYMGSEHALNRDTLLKSIER